MDDLFSIGLDVSGLEPDDRFGLGFCGVKFPGTESRNQTILSAVDKEYGLIECGKMDGGLHRMQHRRQHPGDWGKTDDVFGNQTLQIRPSESDHTGWKHHSSSLGEMVEGGDEKRPQTHSHNDNPLFVHLFSLSEPLDCFEHPRRNRKNRFTYTKNLRRFVSCLFPNIGTVSVTVDYQNIRTRIGNEPEGLSFDIPSPQYHHDGQGSVALAFGEAHKKLDIPPLFRYEPYMAIAAVRRQMGRDKRGLLYLANLHTSLYRLHWIAPSLKEQPPQSARKKRERQQRQKEVSSFHRIPSLSQLHHIFQHLLDFALVRDQENLPVLLLDQMQRLHDHHAALVIL